MLTLNEAAEVLGLAPATLRSQIRNGAIEGRKVGPVWTVTEDAVKTYRERNLGRRFGRDAK